jgi:hypothetical protein
MKKNYLQIKLQPTQLFCEKMGDVRTKINNGKDEELYFLKSDFFRNNLQFSVFNL